MVPWRSRKVGRVWCGGARETCDPRVTIGWMLSRWSIFSISLLLRSLWYETKYENLWDLLFQFNFIWAISKSIYFYWGLYTQLDWSKKKTWFAESRGFFISYLKMVLTKISGEIFAQGTEKMHLSVRVIDREWLTAASIRGQFEN